RSGGRRTTQDAERRDRPAGASGPAVGRAAGAASRRADRVRGRAVFHGRSGAAPGGCWDRGRTGGPGPTLRAIGQPPRADPHRRGSRGGDPPGLPRRGSMKRLIAAALGLGICVVAAAVVYSVLGHALDLTRATLTGLDAPVSDDTTPVVFRVEPGQSAGDIGAALEKRGLIRSSRLFRLLVERDGVAGRLAAGEYDLSPSMSTPEVIAVLAGGRVRPKPMLTVPEGWRAEEIAWQLDTILPGRGQELLAIVYDDAELAASLGLGPDASLEGFLFPDTYELSEDQDVRALVKKMVGQFERRFDPARRDAAASLGLSIREAVTLASIVEREAAVPRERPLIAAVYLNRLAAGMRQQAGLPPGPICNPGLASLDAVLHPAASDALYFVGRGDGTHVFARTMDEHLANIRQYQSSGPN